MPAKQPWRIEVNIYHELYKIYDYKDKPNRAHNLTHRTVLGNSISYWRDKLFRSLPDKSKAFCSVMGNSADKLLHCSVEFSASIAYRGSPRDVGDQKHVHIKLKKWFIPWKCSTKLSICPCILLKSGKQNWTYHGVNSLDLQLYIFQRSKWYSLFDTAEKTLLTCNKAMHLLKFYRTLKTLSWLHNVTVFKI